MQLLGLGFLIIVVADSAYGIMNLQGTYVNGLQDAGPGIPPEDIPLLFGKFVRLKRDMVGSVRGTGLGLYISKQMVENMGGRIWVESTGIAGEGSRFSFTLDAPPPSLPDALDAPPVAQSNADEAHEPAITQSSSVESR